MQKELNRILGRSARRLLFRRIVESAAIGAACAGYCAAVAQLAIWLADRSAAVSASVCVLAVAFGLAVLAGIRISAALRLDRPQRIFLGLCCISAGAVGAAWLAFEYLGMATVSLPVWAIPGGYLAVGVLFGAVRAVARGVSRRQAAIHMDVRGGLSERMSTAFELADEAADDSPLAQAVCADAVGSLQGRSVGRFLAWRRTPATAAALVLAAALCTAMSFLPVRPRAEVIIVASLSDVPDAAGALTADQAQAFAMRLKLLAQNSKLSATLAEALLKSADAAAEADAQAMREAIGRVMQALENADDETLRGMIQTEIAAALEAEVSADIVDASALAGVAQPVQEKQKPAITPDPGKVTRPVAVYHPGYATVASSDGASDDGASRSEAVTMDFDSAWRAARDRAEKAIGSGEIPHEYRPIIQAFYAGQ